MCLLLAIDPDPVSQQSLECLCDRFGMDIVIAGNLSEGIKIYKQRPVDLIVIDLFLPQKSGFSFIAEITSKETHPPIIATFYADRAPRINIKRFAHMLGASYTFEKPFDHRLFQQAVGDLVPYLQSSSPEKD